MRILALMALAVLSSSCGGRYVCFPTSSCKATYRVYYYAGYIDSTAGVPIQKDFRYLK